MLAVQVAAAVRRLRTLDVQKPPGVAEAINWTLALELLGVDVLDTRRCWLRSGRSSSTARTSTCSSIGAPAG